MKKIKYLLLVLFLLMGSVIVVNAALPYEEGMKSMTLYTYDGVYTTTKITQNHSRMKNVLSIISDKTEQEQDGVGGVNLTTLEFYYGDDSKVTVTFYGENTVGITEKNGESKLYEINYEGSAEDKVIDLFSDIIVGNNNGDVSNPETSDNITVIAIVSAVVLGIAVVSYRKRKLS